MSSATSGLEVLKDHNFGIIIVVCLKALHRLPSNGSIPDGVIGIFHKHNFSCRAMALGSTQPLTDLSTRYTSWWAKAAGV